MEFSDKIPIVPKYEGHVTANIHISHVSFDHKVFYFIYLIGYITFFTYPDTSV